MHAAAAAQKTPYGEVTVDFELQQVPGSPVYYVIGQSGVPGPDNEGMTSNAGFVVTDKGVVVYDALGTPALGYLLLEKIREVTDKPVVRVIAGHYHADHVYGLQAFKEHTGAEILAQEKSSVYLGSAEAQDRLAQRRDALWPWVDENTRIVAPDRTFADRQVHDMGNLTLESVYVGPAHAPDDNILVVREAGVVFSGDLIYGGRLPFLGGDNVVTDNWLNGLKRLQEMRPAPRFVIPGHGSASNDAAGAIAFTREYIEFLREHMGKAARDLVGFEEAYAGTDWSRYRDVPTFDAANRRNAYQVYLEMQESVF
jgi:glyoxylase-like metal-dependent hydrolase (beta-lactamase superfamily II)